MANGKQSPPGLKTVDADEQPERRGCGLRPGGGLIHGAEVSGNAVGEQFSKGSRLGLNVQPQRVVKAKRIWLIGSAQRAGDTGAFVLVTILFVSPVGM